MTTPTPSSTAKAPASANNGAGEGGPLSYAMPDFVEDVNWCERLILPDDLSTADWPAWSAAMLRRVQLATTARQIADLSGMNSAGLRQCPARYRMRIAQAMADAAACTADQTL